MDCKQARFGGLAGKQRGSYTGGPAKGRSGGWVARQNSPSVAKQITPAAFSRANLCKL